MRPRNQIAMYTMAAAIAVGAMGGTQAGAAGCDRVASPLGSDAFSGTTGAPYATVEHLANSLNAGQTGCLRAGVYQGDVKITEGGSASAPTMVTSYPGERATVVGRMHVAEEANNVVVQSLDLNGRNGDNLPSPTINGDGVVFRDNDVTNDHTTICFIVGSDEFGRARGTVIEHNRIHNCGQLPPTNHHHGIYVEASDGARITENWIYDNADRGVQLFPDAQGTYVARNVIDGNGQGVIFSRTSANNVVENNVISNPAVRYNIEDWELSGGGNVARRNCIWSTRHRGGGLQPGLAVSAVENLVIEPGFVNRAAKDFRLRPGSPCTNFATALRPQATKRKKRARPVRLRAGTRAVWPGGRLRLRAKVKSPRARAAASSKAVVKVRVGNKWRRVATMRLRGARYISKPQLGKAGHRPARGFGMTRVRRYSGRLKLRAYVPGVGRSNVIRIRIGK